jgi:hypothetical protein
MGTDHVFQRTAASGNKEPSVLRCIIKFDSGNE